MINRATKKPQMQGRKGIFTILDMYGHKNIKQGLMKLAVNEIAFAEET